MASKIFNVVRASILEKFGDSVIVKKGVPNPIVEMFNLIEEVRDGKILAEKITVYSDAKDAMRFTKYIGTDYEKRYFGDLISSGRLLFKSGDIKTLTHAMRDFYPKLSDNKIKELIEVRGSQIRSSIVKNDIGTIEGYIPSFLFETRYNGNKSSDEIIKTLCEE
jgi:hypothetical protein